MTLVQFPQVDLKAITFLLITIETELLKKMGTFEVATYNTGVRVAFTFQGTRGVHALAYLEYCMRSRGSLVGHRWLTGPVGIPHSEHAQYHIGG